MSRAHLVSFNVTPIEDLRIGLDYDIARRTARAQEFRVEIEVVGDYSIVEFLQRMMRDEFEGPMRTEETRPALPPIRPALPPAPAIIEGEFDDE